VTKLRMVSYLLVTAAIFVLGAEAFVARRDAASSRAAIEKLDTELRNVAQRPAPPPRVYNHTRIVERPADSLGTASSGPVSPAQAQRDEAVRPEELAAKARERAMRIEAEFDREAVDHVWGLSAQSEINDAMAELKDENPPQIHSLACKSTQCRLDATYSSVRAFNAAFAAMCSNPESRHLSGRATAPETSVAEDGSAHVVLYVHRK